MSDVKFSYGTKAQLDETPYSDGMIYFIVDDGKDVGKIYTDMKDHRITYSEEMPEITPYDDSELRNQIQEVRNEIQDIPEPYDDTEIRQQIQEVRNEIPEIPEIPEPYDDTVIQERIESLAEEHDGFNNQIASLEAEKQVLNNQVSDLEFTNELLEQRIETLMQMLGCIPHGPQTELKEMSSNSDTLQAIPRNGNSEPFNVEMVFSDGEGNYSIKPAEAQLMSGYDNDIPTRGSYIVTLNDGVPRVVEGLDKPAAVYELRSDFYDTTHTIYSLTMDRWQQLELESPSYNEYPREYRNFIENCLPTKSVTTRLEFDDTYAGLYSLVIHDRTYGITKEADDVVVLECKKDSFGDGAFLTPYSDTIYDKKNGGPITEEQIAAYEEWRQALNAAVEDPQLFDEFVHTRCYYDNIMNYVAYAFLIIYYGFAGKSMLLLTYDNFQHVLFSINPDASDEYYGIMQFNHRTPGGAAVYDARLPFREEFNILFNAFADNYTQEVRQWLRDKIASGASLDLNYILAYISDKMNMIGADQYAEQRASDVNTYHWADHIKFDYFAELLSQRWEWAPDNYNEPEPYWD